MIPDPLRTWLVRFQESWRRQNAPYDVPAVPVSKPNRRRSFPVVDPTVRTPPTAFVEPRRTPAKQRNLPLTNCHVPVPLPTLHREIKITDCPKPLVLPTGQQIFKN